MKGKCNFSLFVVFLFATTSFVYAQNVIKGKVLNADTRKPLEGVSVTIKGRLTGTSTNEKGEFSIVLHEKGGGALEVSHLSYEHRTVSFRGNKKEEYISILLKEKENVVKGAAVVVEGNKYELADERKTPVALANVNRAEIRLRLGNRDFPLILRRTASTYVTPAGGGYGDASINIRGFSQENVAVLVNGMPINDMENGSVYWSNWTGLTDLTTVLQVQRGLGASKLAIPSVGGTVNIMLTTSEMREGGMVSAMVANDGEYKSTVAYSTGKLESGFSAAMLFSKSGGARYIEGTDFQAYNYFIALGFKPVENHNFQFMLTGAPQWHNARYSFISIAKYLRHGSDGNPNRRYNSDTGYLEGQQYNVSQNAYHKPVMTLNWDWKIADFARLSTTAYASFGRGYGTRAYGAINGREMASFRDHETEKYDFDSVVEANKASTPDKGTIILGGRVNSHDWIGLITNYTHKIGDELSLNGGFDIRGYKGYHYVMVNDLLGASAYRDESNKNLLPLTNYISAVNSKKIYFNPFGDKNDEIENTLSYNNIGKVGWLGAFGQVEYDNDGFSAFLEGGISEKAYQRVDNFLLDGTYLRGSTEPLHTETEVERMLGYNLKAGINKVFDKHNIYSNVGYYERQPDFDAVFRGGINHISNQNTNERILGIEVGYGYKSTNLDAKVNLYRTSWKDRFIRKSNLRDIDLNETIYYAEISGVQEVHQGVEVEASYIYNDYVSLKGMFSYGNWYYEGNADAMTYKSSNNRPYLLVGEVSNRVSLLLDNAKVGGTAQMTANLSAIIKPTNYLDFHIDWNYVNDLYANFDIYAFKSKDVANRGALKLPSYNLFDLGVVYRQNLFKTHKMSFALNVNNVLDTYYISESQDNIHANEHSVLYKNIDVNNRVFFGFGRTWNFSMRYTF